MNHGFILIDDEHKTLVFNWKDKTLPMQLDDLEGEDEEFHNFLKEVNVGIRFSLFILCQIRLHRRKNLLKINQQQLLAMNEWQLNPNQVRKVQLHTESFT